VFPHDVAVFMWYKLDLSENSVNFVIIRPEDVSIFLYIETPQLWYLKHDMNTFIHS